ncbi:FtsX-like permease family protein [Actinoplanes sp. NPDC051346]|uniref:FtsX-like permease family protein n=1 Tax=Actinoplanes sp. NPDC051346 TaxID=3155048 RepID=UPI00343A347B
MTRLRRWIFELGLGARMSVAGGRGGWTRLALIAAGVGIGVAVLLSAAALPSAVAASGARTGARAATTEHGHELSKGDDTLLVGRATTKFRGELVEGSLVQPEGSRPPTPPGVSALPRPGELLVSPALADLMAHNPDLARRWDARIVGTIGGQGLSGPAELFFYLGTDTLTDKTADRANAFGDAGKADRGVSPLLVALTAVGMVVLLTPVMVFMAGAVRFGGETRDRRLAALRLVGTDAAMTRRIAAGETLVGAVLGLGVGALLAVGIGLLTTRYATGPLSFYLSDMRPVPALVALILLAVPLVAVLVTLTAMRRVIVQPLGVVRLGSTVRRRLWWRLILPAVGLALLWPLTDGLSEGGAEFQVAAGVALLLTGLALLLPWLVDAFVRRLGGGGLAWELAVRRLQFDSGTAVRAVSGIAVSVAGVIALQGLVTGIEGKFGVSGPARTDPFLHQIEPETGLPDRTWVAALRETPGVRAAQPVRTAIADRDGTEVTVKVGDCAVLVRYTDTTGCTDGDVYGIDLPEGAGAYTLGGTAWTAPAPTRRATAGDKAPRYGPTLLITPSALAGAAIPTARTAYAVTLDTADPDAIERLRTTTVRLDPLAHVYEPGKGDVADAMRTSRQALLAGTIALLLLIGASMVVTVAEQLHERRKVLAVLVAVGTRRRTLTGSVLAQAAVPVVIGMTVAVGFGSAIAAVLRAAVGAPIAVDWFGIGTTSGVAALVVLGATAATMPTLWRLTRPGNLRSE